MRLRVFLVAALAIPFISCYEKDLEGPGPVSAFSITTSVPTLNMRQDDTITFTVAVSQRDARTASRCQRIVRGNRRADRGHGGDDNQPRGVPRHGSGRRDGENHRRIQRPQPGREGHDRRHRHCAASGTLNLTPDSTSAFVGVATTFRATLLDAAGTRSRRAPPRTAFTLRTPRSRRSRPLAWQPARWRDWRGSSRPVRERATRRSSWSRSAR